MPQTHPHPCRSTHSHRCLITDFMGEDAEMERQLLEAAGLQVVVAPTADRDAWVDDAGEADAVITRHARIDETAIDRMRRCRVISRYGTGVDNIDIEAAARRGIPVTYVPGGSTDEVADHTFGLILVGARRLDLLVQHMRQGGWVPVPIPPIKRLRGQVLGLVGAGRIGRAVARRAVAFGMKVVAVDPQAPKPHDVEFDVVPTLSDVLSKADVLSLHIPLTTDTRRLIGEREIQQLRPGAMLVNTARGAVLDLDAAVEALRRGHLGMLALDTYPEEPLASDHPLRKMENAVLTQHLAYYSLDSLRHAKRAVTAEVLAVLGGQSPRHVWPPSTAVV